MPTATLLTRGPQHRGLCVLWAMIAAAAMAGARSAGGAASPGGEWPKEIVADVGPLQVRFESRSFWTLYRIEFQGVRLGLDRWGSHYGSVANFPGVGFIGSGHTENEKEQLREVALWIDGRPQTRPPAAVRCQEIRLHKRSQIRTLRLTNDIRVADGRIWEEARLSATEPTPMSLIYHFMHPWTNTATEFCGMGLDGKPLEGLFVGDKRQKIGRPTRWSALYDGPSGKGVVTYVLRADGKWHTWYWDTPDRYRKHYFVTFCKETVPAGREFRYRIVCAPFAAPANAWRDTAARVAVSLHQLEPESQP